MAGWWTTSGNIGFPPLARVMGVGRQQQGDPLVCGSYKAIKLLEQPMKVLERVLEIRIRCQASIDNMQFGFMPGKGTTDVIFIM